jgi:hypothetical protein
MRKTALSLLIVIMLTAAVGTPTGWAKENGYCYIVSYSTHERVVYFTPVFVARVSGATYSDEEFVADVGLIRELEAQFQKYLSGQGLAPSDFVTSARVAYRSQAIAERRLAAEKGDYSSRGFTIQTADDFRFNN